MKFFAIVSSDNLEVKEVASSEKEIIFIRKKYDNYD